MVLPGFARLPAVPAASDRDLDLLGFGVATVDELIELDSMPEPDVKVDVRSHDTQCGGLCLNALAAAARLDLRCRYVGPLGADRFSGIVRRRMDAAGISYPDDIADPEAGPTHAFILVDRAAGTRTIFMDKSRVRDMAPEDLPDSLLARTRALYVDAWRLAAGLDAVRRAAGLGVTVIADFEEDDPERVRELLPYVDHLILPHAYARRLTGAERVRDVLAALEPQSRPCTAVTCGEAGSFFVCGDEAPEIRYQPAFEVEVVDTTGCGDAFHGAYIAAVLDDRPVAESMRYASAAAALCARALGAQAGLATYEQIAALVQGGTAVAV